MKKRPVQMSLHRETLRRLDSLKGELAHAFGGETENTCVGTSCCPVCDVGFGGAAV